MKAFPSPPREATAPLAALRGLLGTADLPGVAPGLIAASGVTVAELSAPPYVLLDEFVQQVADRWNAPRHVAAAVWWKSFAYWTVLPVSLGWALDRTFPAFTPETTMVDCFPDEPYMRIGATRLAAATDVRATLTGLHTPLIDALHALDRIGRRNLWGSVAEALTQPLVTYRDQLPGEPDRAELLALAGPPVTGLMQLDPPRRRTCCLWVTLPDADACSTCTVRRKETA